MTSAEIREQVSPMVIWMADAAIREARRAIAGKTGWDDINRQPYNLPEVEMAGEVLFNMFATCSASIRIALIKMPEKMDGLMSFHDCKYLDEFVKALQACEPVKLRESNWVLECC